MLRGHVLNLLGEQECVTFQLRPVCSSSHIAPKIGCGRERMPATVKKQCHRCSVAYVRPITHLKMTAANTYRHFARQVASSTLLDPPPIQARRCEVPICDQTS